MPHRSHGPSSRHIVFPIAWRAFRPADQARLTELEPIAWLLRPSSMEHDEPMPEWVRERIYAMLAWDRQLWDIDPPPGWDPHRQRFTAPPNRP